MISRNIAITNRLGMHARAAARFVHTATGFRSDVTIACGPRTMDGKSIMGILLLAAPRGATLRISADGDDEEAAVDALCRLVESGFGEDTWSA